MNTPNHLDAIIDAHDDIAELYSAGPIPGVDVPHPGSMADRIAEMARQFNPEHGGVDPKEAAPAAEAKQEEATGKNHPVIRAAIEASRARGPLQNSAEGSVPRYIQDRENVLGDKS